MSFVVLSLAVLSLLRQVTFVATSSCSDEPVAGSYVMAGTELNSISWKHYNEVIYAFAMTSKDTGNLVLPDGTDSSYLEQFVEEAHMNNVSASVSIGGWTGSTTFSYMVATPQNRTAFVNTVIDLVSKYKFDGIDFDWEYPVKQGIGCNVVNPDDTANFLAFLQELRKNPVGSHLKVSIAATITPYFNSSGQPGNMTGFADVVDSIMLMNYDVFGSWSNGVGPNSPLNDTCAPVGEQDGSAVSAVKGWKDAGVPTNKIVLGVAAYGHSFVVSPTDAFADGSGNLASYPPFNKSSHPLGDSDSSIADSIDICGNVTKPTGVFTFKGLAERGFLNDNGEAASGIYHRFDSCSQTPYVYNKTSRVMVSFDDRKSFAAKGKFIKEEGLKGFRLWKAGDDYKDLLIKSIRAGMGTDTSTPKANKHKRHWKWNH